MALDKSLNLRGKQIKGQIYGNLREFVLWLPEPAKNGDFLYKTAVGEVFAANSNRWDVVVDEEEFEVGLVYKEKTSNYHFQPTDIKGESVLGWAWYAYPSKYFGTYPSKYFGTSMDLSSISRFEKVTAP